MTYARQATYSLFPVLRSCFELLCIALDSTFIIDPMALRIQWLKIYRRSQELVLVKFYFTRDVERGYDSDFSLILRFSLSPGKHN